MRSATAKAAGAAEGETLNVLREAAGEAARPAQAQEAELSQAMTRALDFVEHSVDDANVRLIFLKDLEANEAAAAFLRRNDSIRFQELLHRDSPETRAERLRRELHGGK